MGTTNLTGPLVIGDRPTTAANANQGFVYLAQSFLVSRDATLVQTNSINLPINSQIVEIYADVLTPYDSATSATLTVGSAAAGIQYVTSGNAKSGGRNTTAHNAAQVTAMANIGTNTGLFATITSVGQPNVGLVRVTVQYIQTTAQD